MSTPSKSVCFRLADCGKKKGYKGDEEILEGQLVTTLSSRKHFCGVPEGW